MKDLFIFALLHREAIDEPGFRIAAIVFLLFILVLFHLWEMVY